MSLMVVFTSKSLTNHKRQIRQTYILLYSYKNVFRFEFTDPFHKFLKVRCDDFYSGTTSICGGS